MTTRSNYGDSGLSLGEIQAALESHEGIRQAVVVVWEDEPGEKRLVGYVVARSAEAAPATGDLRGYLKEKLPEYMVPSAYVFFGRAAANLEWEDQSASAAAATGAEREHGGGASAEY